MRTNQTTKPYLLNARSDQKEIHEIQKCKQNQILAKQIQELRPTQYPV